MNCRRIAAITLLSAALFLSTSGPQVVAEEEATIKTPQDKVTLHFKTGKSARGKLVSVDRELVRLQLRPDFSAKRYEVSLIESIETQTQTYIFNASTGKWEAGTKAASRSEGKSMKSTTPGTTTVVVEGVGASKDEALKDAFRAAIRKVVGELVVSKLTVKDDKVIEDKVLTYGAGIIKEGYKELSAKQEDDLWRVKISAKVEQRQVASRLIDAGFKVNVQVDGSALAIEVMTRTEAQQKATELIRDALADLPKVLRAEARKPTASDYDEKKQELRIEIQVRADMKRYETFLNHLNLVLEKVNLRKGGFRTNIEPAEDKTNDGGKLLIRSQTIKPRNLGKGGTIKGGNTASGFMVATLPRDTKGWYLWVLSDMPEKTATTGWSYYLVDSDSEKSLEPLRGKLVVRLTFLDKDEKKIVQEEVDANTVDRTRAQTNFPWLMYTIGESSARKGQSSARKGSSIRRGRDDESQSTVNAVVAPLAMKRLTNALEFKVVKQHRCYVKLSEADLKRIDTIKCEVVLKKTDVTERNSSTRKGKR